MMQNHSGGMTRLIAAGLLPERAGQPVKAWVHVSLANLRALDSGSALQGEWIAAVRAKWAARRSPRRRPGGLASFLRQNQLGTRLAGPSLPLDVGRSPDGTKVLHSHSPPASGP
jgi:hypothetical protein